jgi:hypothetical protein
MLGASIISLDESAHGGRSLLLCEPACVSDTSS